MVKIDIYTSGNTANLFIFFVSSVSPNFFKYSSIICNILYSNKIIIHMIDYYIVIFFYL